MILLTILGCGTVKNTQDTNTEDCSIAPSYEDWAYGFFRGKCQSCHASSAPERYGAPEEVTFDNYEQIQQWLPAIEQSVLENETMPPSGGVTEEEKILLTHWLACPY